MSPAPVMFTPAVTAAAYMQAPTAVHQLLPRQTAPPTTIRNPYMAYYDTKAKSVSSWMSDFSLINATTDGTATSWTAVKSSKVGLDSTLLVTDRVTQVDWHVKQTLTFSDHRDKTEFWNQAIQCSMNTVQGSTDMSCSSTMSRTVMDKTTTYTSVTSESMSRQGPSIIVLPGKAVASATTTSSSSASSSSSSTSSGATISSTASASTSHTSGTSTSASATPSETKKSAASSHNPSAIGTLSACVALGYVALAFLNTAI